MDPKCANCGAEMIEAYTKEALHLYLCPHVEFSTTKTLANRVLHTAIYCNLDVNGLRASFNKLTEDTDVTLAQLRDATQETVTDATLLENANLAAMLNLPVENLPDLFEAAFKLGLAVGIEPTRAIEALCKGVGRRSRLILDNIGITFKPSDAYNWFASKHDLDSLSTDQKTEAWQKYALHLIREKARRL